MGFSGSGAGLDDMCLIQVQLGDIEIWHEFYFKFWVLP
jgi:hypothetical protein